jgi:hypothetical protein
VDSDHVFAQHDISAARVDNDRNHVWPENTKFDDHVWPETFGGDYQPEVTSNTILPSVAKEQLLFPEAAAFVARDDDPFHSDLSVDSSIKNHSISGLENARAIPTTSPQKAKKSSVTIIVPDSSGTVTRPRRNVDRPVDYSKIGKDPITGRIQSTWVKCVIMNRVVVNHISMKAALAGMYKVPSMTAIESEIHNIIDTHDSIRAISYKNLTEGERMRARRNFIFVVLKHKADGSFDKVKARWVYGAANSSAINDDEPRDTASPTVNPATTMAILFMIAAYDMEMETHDVPGAFLKSEMAPDAQPLFGYVGPDITEHIRRLHPELADKISPRGNLFFQLQRFIYGTEEASKRFFDTMSNFLISIGFIQSLCDPCLFILYIDGLLIIAGLFVDDMLVAAQNTTLMEWISNQIRSRWDTTFHQGNEFNYVGLHIVRNRPDRSLRVDMSGNISKVIVQFGDEIKESKVACIDSIMEQTGEPLSEKDRTLYMSLVMSVLYPARMCHLAVLFPTTILATRMLHPTTGDMAHARRLIGFLKTQVHGGITIRGSPTSQLRVYVDASHNIHADSRGHGALIACMDTSPIVWRSYKIPYVCLSSTEDEVTAVAEATTYTIWITDLFTELHHIMPDITSVLQDNTSAVIVMERGGTFKRTKHIMKRFNFIREHVKAGLIKFVRCPTAEHLADLLTKVQTATRQQALLSSLSWTNTGAN